MKKIVIGGCSQEISTFNPVSCQYEYFNFKHGNEIDVDSRGKNSAYAGAINELKKEFKDDLELIFTYDAEGGAAGVGKATTSTVVLSCVTVVILDYVLAAILLP